MIHTVKGFNIVNKAEIDVFLELSCYSDDPVDVGNLISGSFAFSKTSLYIWKFMIHVLLKPGLQNFQQNFTSMWDECNCAVVCAFFSIAFLWDCNKNWHFPVLCPLLSFPNLLAYWVSTFTVSSFRIWNTSTGIPPPPLDLFVVMLPKAHLTSHSRMFGSRWVITPLWLCGSWRFFYTVLLCDSWTVAHKAPPSMGSSRQEYWVAISFSRGSSRPRDRTQISHTAGRCFNLWTTREACILTTSS